jgi:hypothetical protein
MATAAEVAYRGNDLLHLAPQQKVALLGAPAGTRFQAASEKFESERLCADNRVDT